MIIYEVNLIINAEIYQQYLHWLRNHVKEMLKISGFQAAELFSEIRENTNNKKYITVQYRLDNHQSLQNYFDCHATEMRQDGLDRFGDQFQAARRIFEVTGNI